MGFCETDASTLLALRDEKGRALVERNADGRVDAWPRNGLNEHVMARFLWFYWEMHDGVGKHARPCVSTLRTAERWRHGFAPRRAKPQNHKRGRS